ncbi:MAG TPA: hypothetical protein VMS98_19285 [Thermoanaerobaculia bacterium]|nr:hypothetical protein [Thermoanaerobaculia bacterium]
MRHRLSTFSLSLAVILAVGALSAQVPTDPPPPPPPDPAVEETSAAPEPAVEETSEAFEEPLAPPSILSEAAGSAYDRREEFPNVNIYLPEGRASVRLRKLIRNVLFETQLEYKFVNGDISTYLRYKYYARNFTYRLGVFDSVEFPEIGENATSEFERVRGGLVLFGFPRDYNRRLFWLTQGDSLSFGDLANVDNDKKNFYTKVAYQFGTQFDERLNAIVGETRGRQTPVLTAFRDIGPQRTGYALALTQTFNLIGGDFNDTTGENDYSVGDYRYTKLEGEGLRRFDITSTSFIFSRLHIGAFAGYDDFPERDERPAVERTSVPRYEMFRLGGREALRAVDENEFTIGTHELHVTNEYFRPIFRNRDYKMGAFYWNTLYGIAYLGAGTVGIGASQITKTDRYVVDAGLGAEAALTLRDFEVLISVIYAKTLRAPDDIEGANLRFSIRTVR